MRDTVDDSGSRVRIAHSKADDFLAKLKMGVWVVAAFFGIAMAISYYFGAPSNWLTPSVAIECTLVLATVLLEIAHRSHRRNAVAEMTVAHLAAEIERLHGRIGGLEVDIGRLLGEQRGPRH
jgi:hypothetical protein